MRHIAMLSAWPNLSLQFHYRDACAAELDVLVVKGDDARDSVHVLTDGLAQGSCACAVKDADARGVDQQGIVDEVGNGLQGFVCPHASHINLLPEVEMLLPNAVSSLFAYHNSLSCFAFLLSLGWDRGGFQPLDVN